jgi:hypothetical protein
MLTKINCPECNIEFDTDGTHASFHPYNYECSISEWPKSEATIQKLKDRIFVTNERAKLKQFKQIINEHLNSYDTLINSGMPMRGVYTIARSNFPALIDWAEKITENA